VNGFEQLGEQGNELDYVNNKIKWYTGLHRVLLSPKHWEDIPSRINSPKVYDLVKTQVGHLYCCFIEYQVRCVCTLFSDVQHTIVNTIKNILTWDDWGGKLGDITKLEARLKDHANTLLKIKAQGDLSKLVQQGQDQISLLS
jgi:NWD NACHT NTPase-like protein